MNDDRYNRQIEFFSAQGQERLKNTRVGIVGLGGLGAHVSQQLAYLGIDMFVLVDHDVVELSNLNRLVGAVPEDAINRTPKVSVAERTIRGQKPAAKVATFQAQIDDRGAQTGLEDVDVLFGCVDNDTARLKLTEFTSRLGIVYIDLASDIGSEGDFLWYGGRVFIAHDGRQCLSCANELDQRGMALESMDADQRRVHRDIYGVDRDLLDGGGPSVISINGVVASLAVTEFLVMITGVRAPMAHLVYRADQGIVRIHVDHRSGTCYYCDTLWPKEKSA
jgi:molybdopterin/thiamine biosynthesis adenylyltransferase